MKLLMGPWLDIAGDESRDDYYHPFLVFLGVVTTTVALWWFIFSAASWAISTAAQVIIQIWS